MAARRLLIVLLVLLGLSTLAAALVPQRTLRDATTTGTTATRPTTTTPAISESLPPQIPIVIGPKKLPLVEAHLGQQFTLLVKSAKPVQVWIPEFGLFGFAAPKAPARFELLPQVAGTFGVLFAATSKPAAKIKVVPPSAEKQSKRKPKGKSKGAKSRARGGSGRA
jgi:hypothetical protein